MSYPVSLNLEEKKCIVFGAGKIALRRVEKLLDSKAVVTVVAPEIYSDKLKKVTYINDRYHSELINGFFMVFACTDNRKVNEQIVRDSQEKGILVSSVEKSDRYETDFSVPASRTCGDVTVSVDTDGKAPAVSAFICKRFENDIETYALLCNYIEKYRSIVKKKISDQSQRMKIMKMLASEDSFSILKNHGTKAYCKYADEICNRKEIVHKKAIVIASVVNADGFAEKLKATYKNYDIFTASDYTKQFEELKQKGYTHIYCLPLFIIEGEEYGRFYKNISLYKNDFECIVCAKPLFSDSKDYIDFISAFGESNIISHSYKTAYILIGHGTTHCINCTYPALDYFFKQSGWENVFVGTIINYPTKEVVCKQIEKKHFKKIIFVPLMLRAGKHFKKDVLGEAPDSWKSFFERKGFETDIYMHGLIESSDIQRIFFKHLNDIFDTE